MSDRSTRKREAILQAATELFLTREYAGTSMEDIAVAAAVSKQTVYKHFSDKRTLFREVALGSVEPVSRDFQSEVAAVAEAPDVPAALRDLARSYVNAVMNPVPTPASAARGGPFSRSGTQVSRERAEADDRRFDHRIRAAGPPW